MRPLNSTPEPHQATQRRPSTPDIVVIGGGIAGLSAGWALSDQASVVVLEREDQLASHATGRSAAVVSETSGPWELCALAAASRPFLEAPPDGFATVPLTRPRGLMWVSDDAGMDGVVETAERLGVRCLALTPDQAVSLVPALRPDWVGEALLEPDAMSIDVAALVEGHRDQDITGHGRRDPQPDTRSIVAARSRSGRSRHRSARTGSVPTVIAADGPSR